jgi:hypothetical protein
MSDEIIVSADCGQAGSEISVEVVSGGIGPAGPQGPTGATGPQGAAGPAGTTTWAGITGKPSTFAPNLNGVQTFVGADSSTSAINGEAITLGYLQFTADGAPQVYAFTTALRTKLNGIATAATANSTDAQLRDRSTHTGTQAVGTITGLQAALDAKAAFAQVATYAAMLALGTPSVLTTVRVTADENKGATNTVYQLWPNGSRLWIAALAD